MPYTPTCDGEQTSSIYINVKTLIMYYHETSPSVYVSPATDNLRRHVITQRPIPRHAAQGE